MATTKRALVLLLCAGLLSACGAATGDKAPDGAQPKATPIPSRASAAAFLCAPGMAANPCDINLSYQSVPPVGATTTVEVSAKPEAAVDCFFAYPTVTNGPGLNAPAEASPIVTYIAQADAAAFASQCRVFVPLYRQATMAALPLVVAGKDEGRRAMDVAYASLDAAFVDYLVNRSDGRRFALIGHSQGAALLIRLIRERIDGSPELRRRLVSAMLVGANLTVPKGKLVGGAFEHIPLCRSGHELGCAVAYSAFYGQPPVDAFFGVPGQGVGALWGQQGSAGLEVACVNPASFSSGVARLNPRWLDDPSSATPFTTYPGLYRAECHRAAGASWLGVTTLPASSYPAAVHANDRAVAEVSDPRWGLHAVEVGLTLGDLVALLGREVFFMQHHR